MSCLLFCSEEAEEYKRKLIQVRKRQVRGQAVSHYSRGFSSLKRRCNLVFFFFVEIIAAVFDFYLSGRLGKEICVRGVSDSQKEGEGLGWGDTIPCSYFVVSSNLTFVQF